MFVKTTIAIALLASVAMATGTCKSYTLRKEVHDLTEEDWKIYLDTVRKAATTPDPVYGRSIWEVAAIIHNQFNVDVHGSCLFFPWHRLFLAWVEQRLQTINPKFAFFYWDSSKEWDTAGESIIWDYLGRDVNQGPLSNIRFASYNNAYLYRGYNRSSFGTLPSSEVFDGLYQTSLGKRGYNNWAPLAELYHGTLHNIVGQGGYPMASMYSPLDPVFYAHHSDYDWKWMQAQVGWKLAGYGMDFQIGGLLAKNQGTCNLDTVLPAFNQKIGDILDVSNLCVRYALPGYVDPPVTTSTSATSTSSVAHTISLSSSAAASLTTSPAAATSSALPGLTSSTYGAISGTSVQSSIVTNTASVPSASATASYPMVSPSSAATNEPSPSTTYGHVLPTLATSVVVYPHTTIAYEYPIYSPRVPLSDSTYKNRTQSHRKGTECPPPLPESWMKANFKESAIDGKAILEEAQKLCQVVVDKVKSGQVIPPAPKVEDSPARPVIAPADKPAVYGGNAVTPAASVDPNVLSSSSAFSRDASTYIITLVSCIFFSIYLA